MIFCTFLQATDRLMTVDNLFTVSRQLMEDDFEDSVVSGNESNIDDDSLCSALVLCGPHGIGKTAMVYAVAKELGFKVLHFVRLRCIVYLYFYVFVFALTFAYPYNFIFVVSCQFLLTLSGTN